MRGAYIARRPDLFAAQFFSNAEGRFADVTSPVRMMQREILERYLWNYGFAAYSSPAGPAKLLILAFLAGSVLALVSSARLRHRVNAPVLLWVGFSSLAALMVGDSTRQAYYLVYAVVSLTILASAFLYGAWLEYPRWRPALVAVVFAVLAVQSATVLSRIRSNPMRRRFFRS